MAQNLNKVKGVVCIPASLERWKSTENYINEILNFSGVEKFYTPIRDQLKEHIIQLIKKWLESRNTIKTQRAKRKSLNNELREISFTDEQYALIAETLCEELIISFFKEKLKRNTLKVMKKRI